MGRLSKDDLSKIQLENRCWEIDSIIHEKGIDNHSWFSTPKGKALSNMRDLSAQLLKGLYGINVRAYSKKTERQPTSESQNYLD